jgi:hypothetical protein
LVSSYRREREPLLDRLAEPVLLVSAIVAVLYLIATHLADSTAAAMGF